MAKEKMTFTVEGMSCSHCENRVKKALGGLAGVDAVSVDLPGKQVIIEADPTLAQREKVIETIEEQGYDVVR